MLILGEKCSNQHVCCVFCVLYVEYRLAAMLTSELVVFLASLELLPIKSSSHESLIPCRMKCCLCQYSQFVRF